MECIIYCLPLTQTSECYLYIRCAISQRTKCNYRIQSSGILSSRSISHSNNDSHWCNFNSDGINFILSNSWRSSGSLKTRLGHRPNCWNCYWSICSGYSSRSTHLHVRPPENSHRDPQPTVHGTLKSQFLYAEQCRSLRGAIPEYGQVASPDERWQIQSLRYSGHRDRELQKHESANWRTDGNDEYATADAIKFAATGHG